MNPSIEVVSLPVPADLNEASGPRPEVCRVFCATANPVQVIVAGTAQGRRILGVADGASPKGVEGTAEKAERSGMLRRFGYKFA